MAACAVACLARMIEIRRRPGIGRVAIGTDIHTGDVLRRFARGDAAVVTAYAATLHIRVINPDHRCPAGDAVTGFADLG